MFYHIEGLCPRTDIDIGRCGFLIQLWPSWKSAVKDSELTQEKVNVAIHNCHRRWLDGCGFDAIFDPNEDPMARWESKHLNKPKKYSKNARPLYDEHSILVQWGEWGPEHITVPGDACGLDIDKGISAPPNGRVLVPHNIDSKDQVILLLTVFTFFAGSIICESRGKVAQ